MRVPYLGATALLKADLRNTKGEAVTPPRIYWQSLDTSVARVDSAGLVTGVAVGGAKTYVALVKDRFAVAIPGAAVAWTSSDTTVATVDGAGVVTGKAAGTATLTATSSSRSDTATVTVVAPAPAG